MREKRKPKRKYNPDPQKQPTVAQEPKPGPELIVWSFQLFDDCPDWQSENHKDNHFCLIAKRLKDKQGIPWPETRADHSNDHRVPMANLSPEAQKRLMDLQLDDYEVLYSFRLTGKWRIWGIAQDSIFQVLWWDPRHQVCPSKKK